ncbi:MAG: ribbon-helix-helix domain-containing protein [Nocardioidaceae bacterium]
MKVSVSLPDDDIEFLDQLAESHGYASRSAVVHQAIALLRLGGLADAYEDAWMSWDSADQSVWDAVIADGLEA